MTGSDYDGFRQTQAAIVDSAEDTNEWPDLDDEHDEDFLNVDGVLSGF